MKGAFIALFTGIILLCLFCLRLDIYRSSQTTAIHFHDTYFVLSNAFVFIFLFFFPGTFFSIGGLIDNHFRSRLFWVLTVLFLTVDVYYIATFVNAQRQERRKSCSCKKLFSDKTKPGGFSPICHFSFPGSSTGDVRTTITAHPRVKQYFRKNYVLQNRSSCTLFTGSFLSSALLSSPCP